jgi:hypothetical protein
MLPGKSDLQPSSLSLREVLSGRRRLQGCHKLKSFIYDLHFFSSRDTMVIILRGLRAVTGLSAGRSRSCGLSPGRSKRFVYSPKRSDWLWAHLVSCSVGRRGPFPVGKAAGA